MNFEWQTDEDEKVWEPEPELAVVAAPRPRRRWLFLLLVGMVVAFAAFALYRHFTQRVEQVTDETEQAVVDSYHLLRQTAEQQDRELFFQILSGRDPAWTNSQRDLLRANLLFDRSPLGLQGLPAASQVISVSLSPELTSAELVYEQAYQVERGRGLSETVRLRQTAVFRHGAGRWLYAPPTADFWGEPVVIERAQMSLFAPGRDAIIAGRLADDLAGAIAEACSLVNESQLDCPHMTIHLDSDPAALVATAEPTWLLQAGHIVTLPTPSLVGLPADEAGYEALRQWYTLAVVARLLNEAAGWQCCKHVYFYQAMLDWQLAELGLQSWPLMPADYEAMIDRPLRHSELFDLWPVSDAVTLTAEAREQVYALVEFGLHRSPQTSALREQQRLRTSSSFLNWAIPLFGGFQEDAILVREWQLFTYERSLSGQRPLPIPLPDEEIILMCASHPETPWDGLSDLYNYNLAADSTVRTLILRPIRFITALPDLPGLLVGVEEERDGERWGQLWSYQWGPGLIYEGPVADMLSWGANGRDSTGQYFVFSYLGEEGSFQYALVDGWNCRLEACRPQELPGRPVWSPDGTRLLAAGRDHVTGFSAIWYGGAEVSSLNQLGTGELPFWLDNETFGYVELDFEGEPTESGLIFQLLILRHRQFIETVVSNETLRALVPAEMRPNGLYMTGIYPVPDGSGRLLIRGVAWGSGGLPDGTFFFMVDPQGRDYSWLWRSDAFFWGDITFSPDGRWLAMDSTDQSGNNRTVYFYHLEQNRIVPLHHALFWGSYGWSADGQWFWAVQDDLLYLLALDYDYRVVRPLPVSGCRMAAGGGDLRPFQAMRLQEGGVFH